MTPPWQRKLAGALTEHWIDSEVLRDNRLGDPARRPLWVYTPPGYDESSEDLPSIYVIQGMTGQLDMWRNRSAFRPTFPEQLDHDFDMGTIQRCLVCFVDCWTSLGGSQFLDSPATGQLPLLPLRGGDCPSSTSGTARSVHPAIAPSPATRAGAAGRW